MAKIYGSQRKLGYHDIVYNIKTGKFFVPLPGDNYYELDVQTSGGGDPGTGGSTQTTATLPLANPTRLGRASSIGLKTQQDFNNYINTYVEEVEGEASNHFSGNYNDLSNKPSIPTDNAELTNGAGYITLDEVPDPVLEGALVFKGNVANEGALPGDALVGDIYFNEEDSHIYAQGEDGQWHKLNTIDDVDLVGYATEDWVESKNYITADDIPPGFSGDYSDLTNTPDIPENTSDLNNDSGFITLADVPPSPDGGIPEAPTDGKQYARKSSAWAEIEIPEGFSGDYNDLTNQPTIPTDNAELANGANYITLDEVPEGFSGDYNDLTNQPTIPTDNAELANGANYITLDEVPEGFSGDYNDLTNQPTIPTDNAELANGANYITLAEVPEPVLDGALIFKGTIADQDSLPGNSVVGHFYKVTADDSYFAWGEDSQWHNVGSASDVDLSDYARLDGATFTGRVLAGQDFRNGDPSFVGVEIDGEKGIVHVKGKNNTVTPFEVFQSGSNVNNVSASVFRVTNDGGVHIGNEEIQLLPGGDIEAEGDITCDDIKCHKLDLDGTLTTDSDIVLDGGDIKVKDNGRIKLRSDGDGDTIILDGDDGSVVAKEFVGDGSKLTGVGLPDFRTLTPLS